MKKVLFVLFVVSIVFVSCSSSDDGETNHNTDLVGTWDSGLKRFVFNADDSWIFIYNSIPNSLGSFIYSKDKLTLTSTGGSITGACVLSSDKQTLILSGYDGSALVLNDTYIKQP